ncbi:hypothetical protein HA402_006356 [Bradysia odoriphaga]|nr:hypothetical protein HA402_006356 [Bradysia odoriphaga]
METSASTKQNLCSSPDTDRILDETASKEIESVVPRERQQLLKWNGWGYKDSKFIVTTKEEKLTNDNAIVQFVGNRYPIGDTELPYFKQWVIDRFNLDLANKKPAQPMPSTYPAPIVCSEFFDKIKSLNILYSDSGEDRLIRAHGQTLYDIHTLREGTFPRIPDLVLWPRCHADVVQIVKLAHEHNVTVIPFGGGTSVSGSITCPKSESRSILIVDTSQMNRMLWLDKQNMVVCFESGIFGQDLERELRQLGLTVGHEPDSYEFSTLGGWVATRASGMKKNVYGNIEDLVVRVKMVTCKGVLERNCSAPRVSIGPDFNQIIMGSEGTLGVVTEVVLKVRKLPEPASIRLIDNDQFIFGQSLKPEPGFFHGIIDGLKRTYVTKIKGFDVFEGDEENVKRQEKQINQIAKKYGGLPAGATNGERGYLLTFVIAYIRDLALEYYIVAESFETSVPWNNCENLCKNTKNRVRMECAKMGIKYYLISCRVTQTYDSGAAVYFYFGFNYIGLSDPVEAYEHIENCARDEILSCGGSLSHHHGVGKLRSRWYSQSVSTVGVGLYKAAKLELDPKNIFAAGNLLTDEDRGVVPTIQSKL